MLASALATLMPAAIGSLVLFSGTVTLLQFGMVWLPCLVESFLLVWLVRWPNLGKKSMVFAFGAGSFSFLVFIPVLELHWKLLLAPVVLAIVLYRMIKFIGSDTVVQNHKDVLVHDFIFVFASILFLGWIASSLHGISPGARQIVLFSAVSVLGGRLYLSWGLERMDSMATGKLPLVTLFCVLFVVIGILILLIPDLLSLFVKFLALILSGMFIIVYKSILWLVSLLGRHRPLAVSPHHFLVAPSPEQSQTSHHPWVSMVLSQHIIEGIRFLAILFCVSVLLIYIYKKWITKEKTLNHKQGASSVSRTWIWRKKRLGFEQTDDEERIRYQKWLFVQHGKGYTIRDAETAQEFLRRIPNDEQTAIEQQENLETTHRYERIRYGPKKTVVYRKL
jgi:hypothetical protein